MTENEAESLCGVFVCMWLACMCFSSWTDSRMDQRKCRMGSSCVCDGGMGGDVNLPGRVTHERNEGMTLCVEMLFF